LAASLKQPVLDTTMALGQGIAALSDHVSAHISALEERAAKRAEARELSQRVIETSGREERLAAELSRERESLARAQEAGAEVERRYKVMRKVRQAAELARERIVRRVFTETLNRAWRDLFVRLAPEEPFVPAFQVPEGSGGVRARLETVHRDGEPGGSPAAMLSAGNLNTAALTLFLALNLSVAERLPWLLLDDPVQSMDEVHVAQFAALLRRLTTTLGRRVILAVHERALFEYLKLELSPAGPKEPLITVELTRGLDGSTSAEPQFHRFIEDHAFASV
jgi:exonuclease SbcC